MARVRLPEWDEFISRVVRQVRFTPDRRGIKRELEAHLEDAAAQRMADGADARQAAAEAVAGMGDPEEIGRELNRAHNQFIGWTWLISKWAFIVVILMLGLSGSLFIIVTDLFAPRVVSYEELDEEYNVGDPVYTAEVGESQSLGSRTVTLDEVLIYSDGRVEVRCNTSFPALARSERVMWRPDYVRDDTGNYIELERFRADSILFGTYYVQYTSPMRPVVITDPEGIAISDEATTLWIGNGHTGQELEFRVDIGDWRAAA